MHSDNVSTTESESKDRKTTKPIMEKRRRARINASLAELKSLLLEVIKREGARHSKMEKADILEMTVKHLRDMQRQSFTGDASNDPTVSDKQKLGFSECTQEVSRYLSNMDGCDVELRTRLLDHLANFVSGLDHRSSPSPPVTSLPAAPPSACPLSMLPGSQPAFTSPNEQPHLPQTLQTNPFSSDMNNNITILSPPQPAQPPRFVSGLQVIPAKLQTGEIAFVLPGTSTGASHVSNYVIPVFTSPSTSQPKPSLTMATGIANPSAYMTIVPTADVFQTCTLSHGSFNVISRPVSPTSSPVSPSSTSTSSMLTMTSSARKPESDASYIRVPSHFRQGRELHDGDVPNLLEVRHRNVGNLHEMHHEYVSDFSEVSHQNLGIREGRHDDRSDDGLRRHVGRESGEDRTSSGKGQQESSKEQRHDVRHSGEELLHDVRDLAVVHPHDMRHCGEICRHEDRSLVGVRRQDEREMGEVRRHCVRDIGAVRHENMRRVSDGEHQDGGNRNMRQRDDRVIEEMRHEQNMDTVVWRPW